MVWMSWAVHSAAGRLDIQIWQEDPQLCGTRYQICLNFMFWILPYPWKFEATSDSTTVDVNASNLAAITAADPCGGGGIIWEGQKLFYGMKKLQKAFIKQTQNFPNGQAPFSLVHRLGNCDRCCSKYIHFNQAKNRKFLAARPVFTIASHNPSQWFQPQLWYSGRPTKLSNTIWIQFLY